MQLSPFLLDQWLAKYEFREPPVRYNLAASTGPRWLFEEVASLPAGQLNFSKSALTYAPPEGTPELRAEIANYYEVDPDWVLLTTGASEALSILLCLAAQPKANVVIPNPGYPAYAAMAGAWSLGVRQFQLLREKDYDQKSEAVLGAVDDDTVLALVNTPHLPTGSVFSGAEVKALAAALDGKGIPLVIDEVFHPLYYDMEQQTAAGFRNVIVIGDMSKAFSLAGLRVGWIIDANSKRRERIINARSYFTVSGSPITEAVATHALRNRDRLLTKIISTCPVNLGILADMIDQSDILSWVRPKGGTTCFPWFSDGRDSRPFCETLAEAGVLIVPGDCFGAPEHMRIGFGAQAEGFGQAVRILRDALEAIR